MGEWQPIETAPKGVRVLIAYPSPLQERTILVSEGQYWNFKDLVGWKCNTSSAVPIEPTHWMPMPEPPQQRDRPALRAEAESLGATEMELLHNDSPGNLRALIDGRRK